MHKRFISLVILVVAIATLLVFQATRESAVQVLLPSDLLAMPHDKPLRRVRVGGRVANQEINYIIEPQIKLTFMLENPVQATGFVPVIYDDLKPDMFTAGRDVIIDGEYRGGVLYAHNLLTQCPSKYEPPLPK